MSARSLEKGLVGIDIGATNIKCAIGVHNTREDVIDIIATSSVPTTGIRDGRVVQPRELARVIYEGIGRAREHGQCEVTQALIGISSHCFYTLDAGSSLDISEGRVTHQDILKVVRNCHEDAPHSKAAQGAYGITHTLTQEYSLDHETIIGSPWSQPALHLGLKAHLVYGHRDTMQVMWGLEEYLPAPLLDVVATLLAQAEGFIDPERPPERLAILDIGSETTKILMLKRGKPVFMFTRNQGGVHLTTEIQRQLKIHDFDDAELLKRRHAQVYIDTHDRNEQRIPVESDGPRRYIRQESLARILERGLTENLSAMRVRLEEAGVEDLLGGGVLLTGGTANIPGICPLAGDILQTKVALGRPRQRGVKDLVTTPQFAGANGLVVAGFRQRHDHWFSSWNRDLSTIPNPERRPTRQISWLSPLWEKLRSTSRSGQ